jgi:mitochondrial chaperone BCS1
MIPNRYQSSVTFSGFLNALDGVASSEERIIFMTTNHLQELDPALIRPGRVDVPVLLDDATPSQGRRLFAQFYEDGEGITSVASELEDPLNQDELRRLADSLESCIDDGMRSGRRVSMAALQGLFILNGPRAAVSKISALLSQRQPERSTTNER